MQAKTDEVTLALISSKTIESIEFLCHYNFLGLLTHGKWAHCTVS